MTVSRYTRTPIIRGGRQYGTARQATIIYNAVQRGLIPTTTKQLQERQRLDILAGQFLGDGRHWWVIAAASGIGWNLQVPAGTVLTIPSNIGDIEALVG